MAIRFRKILAHISFSILSHFFLLVFNFCLQLLLIKSLNIFLIFMFFGDIYPWYSLTCLITKTFSVQFGWYHTTKIFLIFVLWYSWTEYGLLCINIDIKIDICISLKISKVLSIVLWIILLYSSINSKVLLMYVFFNIAVYTYRFCFLKL